MINIALLIAFAVIVTSATICRPGLLGSNAFLGSFVNHEILALMAVILTVTLASVANIHLALNRIIMQRFVGNETMKGAAQHVRKEINENAWYLFWGFLGTVVALFIKGFAPENIFVLSAVHGVALWILLLFLLAMFDIYKVVFGIAELELTLGGKSPAPSFDGDTPSIGGE